MSRPNLNVDLRHLHGGEAESQAAPSGLTGAQLGERAEIARLREDNDDLRGSAFYWKRLYEAALRRVNELELRLDTRRADAPDQF
jgi:hypothetical protein